MIVEILSTGTELLRGRNVDTNAAWLSRECGKAGLEVLHHQTVDDDFGRLVDAVKLAAARSDVILMTGGLGPTEDDYTRRVAEEAFHRPLGFRAPAWKAIRERFRKYGTPMAAINRRQAYAPRGATLLANPNGSAPGFMLQASGVRFAAMPGPPREMYPMFLRQVLPRIRERTDVSLWEGKSFGLPEGHVDEIVLGAVGDPQAYGLTVRGGQVSIWIRALGPGRQGRLRRWSSRVIARLGRCHYPEELADHVARRLEETGNTLAAAESCT
ncbi:MAG TPA: competence/damage-inducible protein A, partial [Planctomycetota bacterium]|nr:competence/damage-inducible protein A [Planctomycetota bacterium]